MWLWSFIKVIGSVFFLGFLVSCGSGSGSGGGSSTSNVECSGGAFKELGFSGTGSKSIGTDTTDCFKFSATENKTYKLVAKGDVAIAANKSSDLNESGLIVYSIYSPDQYNDIIFTAEKTTVYYVEVYAIEESSYSLELQEVNTDDYLSVNNKNIISSSISSYNLPPTHKLMQPDAPVQAITSNYTNVSNSSLSVNLIESVSNTKWFDFNLLSDLNNSSEHEYIIIDSDFPVGEYKAQVNFTYFNDYNFRVFQPVTINHSIVKRPFDITFDSNQNVALDSDFTTSLATNSSQQLTYKINYAPNGMIIDASGQITWRASMPIFKNDMLVNWGASASLNGVSLVIEDTITLSSLTYTEPLVRTGMIFSDFVYYGNTVSADWDNDGKTEIISSDMNKVLYSVEYNNGSYHEEWVNPYGLSKKQRINTLATADLNNDGVEELIIGMHDIDDSLSNHAAKLLVMDGVTKNVITSIDTDLERVRSIHSGDIDGDGKIEVVIDDVIASGQLIRVYEGINLTSEWISPLYSGTTGLNAIRLGNVDADPALEIVSGTGYVIDGLTHIYTLIKSDGFFGWAMSVGDADNDGIDDIIQSTSDFLNIYNGINGELKYQLDTSQLSQFYKGRFQDVIVGDIFGQGMNHLIASVDNTRDEVAFFMFNDVTSEFELDRSVFSVSNNNVKNLLLDDFDNDGFLEILWREGGGSTAKDGLVVAGFQVGVSSADVEWYTNNPTEYDYHGFHTPQFTKNLTNENKVWFTSNDSALLDSIDATLKGPRIIELSLLTGELTASDSLYTPYLSGFSCTRYMSMIAIDLNQDTYKDAILPPCTYSSPALLIDLQDGATIQGGVLGLVNRGGNIKAAVADDLDNNGSIEVAVLTEYGYVFVYDPLTNNILWESGKLDPNSNSYTGQNISAKDLDGNGTLELIVVQDELLKVFNYSATNSTFILTDELILDIVEAMTVGDIDGDGKNEIIVVQREDIYNRRYTVYSDQLSLIASNSIDFEVSSVYLEDLPGNRKNIVMATRKKVNLGGSNNYETNTLLAIDPLSGKEIWKSPDLMGFIYSNGLIYGDVDNDGNLEMIFTTNKAINVIY